MFLDEPTAALDLGHQELVMGLIDEQAKAGKTVVVVVHDLNLAARYANRIVVLDQGHVAADGSPTQALQQDLLSRLSRHPVVVLPHPLLPGRPMVVPAPCLFTSPKPGVIMTATKTFDRHRDGGIDRQPDVARTTHAEQTRTLLHAQSRALLSTVARGPAGYPFGSLVTYAAEYETAEPDPIASHAAGIITDMNDDHLDAQITLVERYLGHVAHEARMLRWTQSVVVISARTRTNHESSLRAR